MQDPEAFLDQCRMPLYQANTCIYAHASYDTFVPMKDQSARLLRWTSIEDVAPVPYLSGKTVVVGHTPKPFVRHYGHLV